MKKILSFMLMLWCMGLYAQNVAVSCDRVNVFWEVIPNPISIAVENVPSNRLIIETDNGIIKKSVDGVFTISSLKVGIAHISIKQKVGNATKLIGMKSVRVNMLPSPIVVLAGKTGGDIRKPLLQSQLGLVCRFDGFDWDCNFKIAQFNVNIFRNGTPIYNESITGNRFSSKTLAAFNTTEANDVLIFSNIYFQSADSSERKLENLEFKIIP